MKTNDYDDMQSDLTEVIKSFLRTNLSKDYYHGKIQVVVITTNTVTGKVNIDSCNVPLVADTKKLLREGYDQLSRAQLINAMRSVFIQPKKKRRKKKCATKG